MNIEQIKTGLQDLINRLQDAEKGYKEIIHASSNPLVNQWLEEYASERHKMHQVLEAEMIKLGGKPEVKTTFLGDLHRLFIDIKINTSSADNEFIAIVDEIERGATTIISDFSKVLSDIEMGPELAAILTNQKNLISKELDSLTQLRDQILEASS